MGLLARPSAGSLLAQVATEATGAYRGRAAACSAAAVGSAFAQAKFLAHLRKMLQVEGAAQAADYLELTLRKDDKPALRRLASEWPAFSQVRARLPAASVPCILTIWRVPSGRRVQLAAACFCATAHVRCRGAENRSAAAHARAQLRAQLFGLRAAGQGDPKAAKLAELLEAHFRGATASGLDGESRAIVFTSLRDSVSGLCDALNRLPDGIVTARCGRT